MILLPVPVLAEPKTKPGSGKTAGVRCGEARWSTRETHPDWNNA